MPFARPLNEVGATSRFNMREMYHFRCSTLFDYKFSTVVLRTQQAPFGQLRAPFEENKLLKTLILAIEENSVTSLK